MKTPATLCWGVVPVVLFRTPPESGAQGPSGAPWAQPCTIGRIKPFFQHLILEGRLNWNLGDWFWYLNFIDIFRYIKMSIQLNFLSIQFAKGFAVLAIFWMITWWDERWSGPELCPAGRKIQSEWWLPKSNKVAVVVIKLGKPWEKHGKTPICMHL